MKSWKLLLAFCVSVFLLFGCSTSRPVLNINSTVPGHLTVAEVEKSILKAQEADRGWVLNKVSNGVIKGEIHLRTFSAEVQITYTAKGYAIKYVTSNNLGAANGKIHRNYNRWVANLDKDIQAILRAQ